MPRTPRPSVRRWPAVVAALGAPLALAVVLLAAVWAPSDALPQVRAAVVNHDEPVTLEGQYTPLGRQLAGALAEGAEVDMNYDWVVTDSDDAAAGLADGTYAAVVTIPENFSAAATSFAGGDGAVEQATVEITSPPGATAVDQALAATVTTTATRVLGSQLTTTYVENVLVGFSTLSDKLGEAADGATQLADGVGQLADGTGQLADGAAGLADGAGQLAGGVRELRGGSYELAVGTQRLAGGARQLADGAQQLAGGAGDSAAGARALAAGAGELSAGTTQLSGALSATSAGVTSLPLLAQGASGVAGGVQQVVDGAVAARDQVAGGVTAVDGALVQNGARIDELGCTADSTDADCVGLLTERTALREQRAALVEQRDLADAQVAQLQELLAAAQQVAGGLDVAVNGVPGDPQNPGLVAGLRQLAGGAGKLDGGAQQLAVGTTQLADGLDQLAAATSGLAGGADGLADGAATLAGGTSQLAAGVARLDGGAAQLADGSAQLADGVRATNDGAVQLADGSAQLGTGLGEAVDQLPTTPEDERADLAKVVTAPVAAPATAVTAPLGRVSTLLAVALWVGALVLFLVMRPLPVRVAGSTRSAFAQATGAFALPAAVSAVAGLATGALGGAVTGQDGGRVLGLALVGALAAVALAAFHQAVAAWFGTAGRIVAVVAAFAFLVAGLAATVPSWVGASVGWLPLGPAADAFGSVVGESPASLTGTVVALALWTGAALLATTGAAARARQAAGARTVAAYA